MDGDIKFRFWNHKSKSFCFDRWIDSDGDIFKQSPAFDDYYCELNECDEVTAQQYAGMKDKNDKEIYAGDIISASIETPPTQEEPLGGSVCLQGAVSFECGSFLVNGEYLWCEHIYNIEVIGNIYENPELLGGA